LEKVLGDLNGKEVKREMRHLDLEIEKLEQRIAPGIIGCYNNESQSKSKSHNSKSKSNNSKSKSNNSKSKSHNSQSKSKSYGY
jgi:hypothetical protein